mgnify:FL=1
MRYFKLYIIPVLVAAVASCTKVEGPEGGVSPEGRAVSISVGVDSPAGGVSGVEAAVAGLPATRAEGSTPYSGSTLGLFLDYGIDPIEGNHPDTKLNYLWSNDGSNNWTTKGQMLWGKSSDKVGVYAYAPYLDGQEDASGVVFTIPTDQSEGLEAADLLWWYPGIENNARTDVTAGSFTDGRIDIAFRHALIKLTVNFELGTQFDGENISIKEAWFHQSIDKVAINFTGSGNNSIPYVGMSSTTSSNATSIKMHNCSSEGKLSCEVLFFPHSLTKDLKLLTVTLSDGRDYILTLDKDLGLWERATGGYVTGVAYEMAVTVGKTKLEGGVITVSPWTDKGSLGDNFGTDATEYSEWDGTEIATAYAGGSGTSEDPYQIATAAQLAFLAQEANKEGSEYQWAETRKYFKLTANINLKGHEWTPIGSESLRFAGSFDGDGHVIVNLNVKGAGRFAGLFGWIRNGATVKNLVIRNASVSAVSPGSETQNPEAYSGIVAAYCAGGCTISNCKVDGTVTSDYCAGGIVGYSANDSAPYNDGAITYCTADVVCSVSGSKSDSYCGGIAGHSCVKMYGCTVRGRIDGPCDVGGLVGWLGTGGSFDYPFSYVYADVGISKVELTNLSPSIGGLVGSAYSSGSKIFNCYMKGKVSCAEGLALDDVQSFYIGGIIGTAQNVELAGCHYRGSISVGKPANGKLYTGFFIGELMSGVKATNNNSYRIDGAAGLPVYGYKADGVDDSEIYIEAIE